MIQFEKIITRPGELIVAKQLKEKTFAAPLHYHPEIELTLILKSSGKRFVGDSIENFGPGDLVLVGENIPHFWHNEDNSSEENYSRAIVVQFNKSFLGEHFFKSAGADHIDKLIKNSSRGICLKDPSTKLLIRQKLFAMLTLKTFEKTLLLLEILNLLAKSKNVHYLLSPGFKPYLHEIDYTRMNKVYNYIYNNISSSFDIAEIAGLLNMSVSSFCHYFKKKTQKTFTRFINEVRIGKAKRLLIETDLSIAEIAYESGYNSLSNFNKQFSFFVKSSPKSFRKEFLEFS